jgi:glycine betaine/proline transport system ATP-binding protein
MKDGEIVQVGTPEDVVANPINDYVRDFSKDVPRHKVLTASKIMAGNYPTMYASDSAAAALTKMRDDSSQAVFVVGPGGDYLGTLGRSTAESADGDVDIGGIASADEPISPNILIDKLINRIATTDVPVPVVDDKNALVGAVDRTAIMLALEEDGG